MQKLTPCLWFDSNAEEAVKMYISIFKNSKTLSTAHYDEPSSLASGRPKGSVLTVEFQINGQKFIALNGGPIFQLNPSISFFVQCKTEKEVVNYFKKLSKGGQILMPLDKYPFSEKYAFIKDKFGISWQIILSQKKKGIVPSLLFVGKDLGKAEAAVKFYTKVFKKSKITSMSHYGKGQNGKEGTVMHSSFSIEDQDFVAMDGAGPHKFAFNESISFIVNCKTQKEVDYYWEKLSAVPASEMCGWLKDKFGISWQIVPVALDKMLVDKNKKKSQNAMKAMLQMKKLDIKTLQKAYNSK